MRRALRDDDTGFAPGGDACVREATRRDLEHLIDHAEALPGSVYATRLGHGDRCFCLVAGSEVRSFNWVSHDRACVMRGFENSIDFLDLTPGQAFTYDFYTYTACRGRGAGRDLKRGIMAALAREGGREVLSLVRPESPASCHLHVSLGYQPDCMVYGYRLGSWQHTFFRPTPLAFATAGSGTRRAGYRGVD
jgi:hypothetical protein